MYSYEERMRAVQLYIEYYFSPSDVIYEIGYPSRNRLRQWYKEYLETGTLRGDMLPIVFFAIPNCNEMHTTKSSQILDLGTLIP